MSGALIAFYQIQYGIAAFGVGPLTHRPDFATLFSAGSIIALTAIAVQLFSSRTCDGVMPSLQNL